MQKKSKFPHKNSKFFICIFKEKVPTSLHDLVMNMEFSQNSIFAPKCRLNHILIHKNKCSCG